MEKNNNSSIGLNANTYNSEDREFSSHNSASSVQSLVNHNQDLSARLHVSLKKNIDLEKTIARFKKAHSQYEERFQSAKDQIAIYREKDRHSITQIKTYNEKFTRLRAHLEYERKESKEEIQKLSDQLMPLQAVNIEYKKIKKRVAEEYLPERDLLSQRLAEEKKKVEQEASDKKSVLAKLGEATRHIQALAKDFKTQITTLRNDHAKEKKALELKLEDVKNENIVLSDRNRILRKEQIERTELLNRIEDLKKEKEYSFKAAQEEKEDILIQLTHIKNENSRIKMENHDIKKQWAKTQAEYRNFKSANLTAQDEAQNLRALWEEKTKKTDGIEKLNDSLSTQITEMETKLKITSTMHEETKQRLKFLFTQLTNITDKQNERDKKATNALERAFKKAVEPFTEFDYNL